MIDELELRDLLDIPDGMDTMQAVKQFYQEYQLLLEREMIGSESSTGVLMRRLETEKELLQAREILTQQDRKINYLTSEIEELKLVIDKLKRHQ